MRALSEVRLSGPSLKADLTDRSLLGEVGVISEVSVGPDYDDLPPSWSKTASTASATTPATTGVSVWSR